MKITIQAGENTYLIASKTIPVDGIGIYQGRLLNELKISRRFSKAGNAPLTLNISIRNNDGFIPRAINLWATVVTVVTDAGYRWVGKITAYDRDSADVLNIVATERSAPELRIQFPDEVAGVVTLDENAHQSTLTLTLPLVAGGNADQPILLKGILVDKSQGIYYLCVGEIHQVVKVYRGDKEIITGFSAFTGSAGQANRAGYAYVQITDEALRKNDDGTYSEITADVIGLKLGSHSIEECRNGARFLQYLLSTPKDGICGWGLGISSSEINSASFATAISRVDAAGLKMDGVFYFRQIAQSWIDQICQAIRGYYEIGENGQRRLFVNANTASVKTYTKKNIKLLRDGKGSYSGQVYNKGRLEFDYNPLTGIFMQSAQFQDPDCIDDIEEQLFLGQSYLIRDMGTAQAILEYTCKKSIVGADKVYFETLELPDDVKKGDIITIDYPEKALTGTWQIFAFDIGDYKHTIEAEKISSDIFVVGSPGVRIDWPIEIPITSTVNPGSASGLTLSSEVRSLLDGTNIVVIKGSFNPPQGAFFAASVEWAKGPLPVLEWNSLGLLQGNFFEISPVVPGETYAVRVRMTSVTSKSIFITGTIMAEGDTEAPGKPVITKVTSFLKNVLLEVSVSEPPHDMAGFVAYRSKTNDISTAIEAGSVVARSGTGVVPDVAISENYGETLYYWVKAKDSWGNLGPESDPVSFIFYGKLSEYVYLGDENAALWVAGSENPGDPSLAPFLVNPDGSGVIAGIPFTNTGVNAYSLPQDSVFGYGHPAIRTGLKAGAKEVGSGRDLDAIALETFTETRSAVGNAGEVLSVEVEGDITTITTSKAIRLRAGQKYQIQFGLGGGGVLEAIAEDATTDTFSFVDSGAGVTIGDIAEIHCLMMQFYVGLVTSVSDPGQPTSIGCSDEFTMIAGRQYWLFFPTGFVGKFGLPKVLKDAKTNTFYFDRDLTDGMYPPWRLPYVGEPLYIEEQILDEFEAGDYARASFAGGMAVFDYSSEFSEAEGCIAGQIAINRRRLLQGGPQVDLESELRAIANITVWNTEIPRKNLFSGFFTNSLITGFLNNFALPDFGANQIPEPVLEKVLGLDVTFFSGTSDLLPGVPLEPSYTLDPMQFGSVFPEISNGDCFYRCLPELLLKAFQEYVASQESVASQDWATLEDAETGSSSDKIMSPAATRHAIRHAIETKQLFGSSVLNGLDGAAITITPPEEEFNDYFVAITLTESPGGNLGEIWVTKDSLSQFTVYNSGSATTSFDWQVDWKKIIEIISYFTFDASTGTITAYNPAGGLDVVIPAVIGGESVVAVGEQAATAMGITSLSMLDANLESIGMGAFAMNFITELSLPETLISVGGQAFMANSLSMIDFGANLESIGMAAFFVAMSHDSNFIIDIEDLPPGLANELEFGNQLSFIGFAAFGGLPITKITIPAGVEIKWESEGMPALQVFLTMGIYSEGFRLLYTASPLAGTYEYISGSWAKTA